MSETLSANPSLLSQSNSDLKSRKPYTMSKPREIWAPEEHSKFVEALTLYERDWKSIRNHIGTKSIIQIRSHAQKYFIKMAKVGMELYIPPPRPKRKKRNSQFENSSSPSKESHKSPTHIMKATPAAATSASFPVFASVPAITASNSTAAAIITSGNYGLSASAPTNLNIALGTPMVAKAAIAQVPNMIPQVVANPMQIIPAQAASVMTQPTTTTYYNIPQHQLANVLSIGVPGLIHNTTPQYTIGPALQNLGNTMLFQTLGASSTTPAPQTFTVPHIRPMPHRPSPILGRMDESFTNSPISTGATRKTDSNGSKSISPSISLHSPVDDRVIYSNTNNSGKGISNSENKTYNKFLQRNRRDSLAIMEDVSKTLALLKQSGSGAHAFSPFASPSPRETKSNAKSSSNSSDFDSDSLYEHSDVAESNDSDTQSDDDREYKGSNYNERTNGRSKRYPYRRSSRASITASSDNISRKRSASSRASGPHKMSRLHERSRESHGENGSSEYHQSTKAEPLQRLVNSAIENRQNTPTEISAFSQRDRPTANSTPNGPPSSSRSSTSNSQFLRLPQSGFSPVVRSSTPLQVLPLSPSRNNTPIGPSNSILYNRLSIPAASTYSITSPSPSAVSISPAPGTFISDNQSFQGAIYHYNAASPAFSFTSMSPAPAAHIGNPTPHENIYYISSPSNILTTPQGEATFMVNSSSAQTLSSRTTLIPSPAYYNSLSSSSVMGV